MSRARKAAARTLDGSACAGELSTISTALVKQQVRQYHDQSEQKRSQAIHDESSRYIDGNFAVQFQTFPKCFTARAF